MCVSGDHQQLRPSTSNYFLTKQTELDVSLFERLIRNGLPHVTLEEQHRMHPDISILMKNVFYPNLKDHSNLSYNRPRVLGMNNHRLAFVNHTHQEGAVTDGKSKVNLYEALFLLHLARYLIQSGNSGRRITLLTTYIGQLMLIEKVRSKKKKSLFYFAYQLLMLLFHITRSECKTLPTAQRF